MRELLNTFKDAFRGYSQDGVPRMAAAISYYTIFSIAPLLIIIIAIVGFVYGDEQARQQLLGQVSQALGPQAAQQIGTMIEQTNQGGSGVVATVIGIVTVLVGATGVFTQLQKSLNDIWKSGPDKSKGALHTLWLRFRGLLMVLVLGLVLILAFALQSALNVIITNFQDLLPGGNWIWYIANLVLTIAIYTGIFMLLFKLIPDAETSWSEVWRGALLTAILLKIGEIALGIYLGTSGVSSAYGAAGSLVVLLLYVFYSAQIVLFGAEFTHADAKRLRAQDESAAEGQPATSS